MKLEVFTNTAPDENITRLRLVQEDGSVCLIAVDESGEIIPGGYICRLTTTGNLYLHKHVTRTHGFDLDDRGCITLSDMP